LNFQCKALAVYAVMGLPPSLAGAFHVIVIDDALPAVGAAVTAVGAPGAEIVLTLTRGLDAGLPPPALVATTSTKYSVTGFSPAIAHDVAEADAVVQVPTGDAPVRAVSAVAVYPVIGLPPSLAGAFHVTVIDDEVPAVGAAVTPFGAPGGMGSGVHLFPGRMITGCPFGQVPPLKFCPVAYTPVRIAFLASTL